MRYPDAAVHARRASDLAQGRLRAGQLGAIGGAGLGPAHLAAALSALHHGGHLRRRLRDSHVLD